MPFKMFDASPFRLGGFAAADPIGVYSTLFMSYPSNEGFPVANISPTNDGYPWNVYVPLRYVVGPAAPRPGWPDSDHGRPRRGSY